MARFSAKQYAQAMMAVFDDDQSPEIKIVAANFWQLLKKNNDSAKLPAILQRLQLLQNQEQGILPVKIASAAPLSDEAQTWLTTKLQHQTKAKTFVIEKVVEPELLGGVVISYQDKVLDGSLAYHLQQLKQQLVTL